MNRTVVIMGISIIAILSIMLSIILLRLFFFNPTRQLPEGKPLLVSGNFDKQIQRFAGGLQFKTISSLNCEEMDSAAFQGFSTFLQSEYPLLQTLLEKHKINDYTLVFRWPGQTPSLKPILFLAHYDVVPAPEENNAKPWTHPPFSGTVTNDSIYGRGALDMKGMLFSLFDASERLMENGFTPKRDIYFVFGHDEEVGGKHGGAKIAHYFEKQCILFDAVFDEGGVIASAGTGGIPRDVALIGIAEKGKSTLRIRAKSAGGHASMPPNNSALGIIAKTITNLEESQMPPALIPPVYNLLCNISADMDFGSRLALANHLLLESVILNKMQQHPATAAMTRTTTAATMAHAGESDNVLPSKAEAVINFRILPGNTVADVQKHMENAIQGMEVEIETIDSAEPSPVSPTNTQGYIRLTETIQQIYPEAIITPYLTIAATDSRNYYAVSPNVYRFMPILINENEQQSIHNTNERISKENYKRMIYFYEQLMSRYDK